MIKLKTPIYGREEIKDIKKRLSMRSLKLHAVKGRHQCFTVEDSRAYNGPHSTGWVLDAKENYMEFEGTRKMFDNYLSVVVSMGEEWLDEVSLRKLAFDLKGFGAYSYYTTHVAWPEEIATILNASFDMGRKDLHVKVDTDKLLARFPGNMKSQVFLEAIEKYNQKHKEMWDKVDKLTASVDPVSPYRCPANLYLEKMLEDISEIEPDFLMVTTVTQLKNLGHIRTIQLCKDKIGEIEASKTQREVKYYDLDISKLYPTRG